jgi:hypothetical protein
MDSHRIGLIVSLVGAVSCATTWSCTNVLGIEDTTLQTAQKAVPSEDWSCVGQPRAAASGAKMTLIVKTVEFLSASQTKVVPDVDVLECSRFDPSCSASPVLAGTTGASGDLSSVLTVDAKKGFDNYFQFSKTGYKTLKWLFSQPRTSSTLTMTVMMVSDAAFTGMTQGLGFTADPGKGHLTYSIVTCASDANGAPVPAANAALSVTPRNAEAMGYYAGSEGGFIDDKTQAKTTAAGRGAVFNLSAVPVTVSVKFGALEVAWEEAIPIQPDTITTIDLFPEQTAAP